MPVDDAGRGALAVEQHLQAGDFRPAGEDDGRLLRPLGRRRRAIVRRPHHGAVVERLALDRLARHDARLRFRGIGARRVGIDFLRRVGESVFRHIRLARIFRILLDRAPVVVRPRPVGNVRIRIFEQEAALVAVQFAQPPHVAIVAVLARPLDAEHFAGEGIDDHAPPVLVDVDLDVARLGETKRHFGRGRCDSRDAGDIARIGRGDGIDGQKAGKECRHDKGLAGDVYQERSPVEIRRRQAPANLNHACLPA